jgi:hypothetical protein
LSSDIMRAKWTHLLAVLAAVALASPYGQAQPASPSGPPLFDKELIVATKEGAAFRRGAAIALGAASAVHAEN